MATQSQGVSTGRSYVVDPKDHGQILSFGNGADGRVGTFAIQFVAAPGYTGSFAVVGRVYGKPANDDGVGFVAIPYKRVNFDGIAQDRTLVSDGLAIAATSFVIEVPCNGLTVGFLTACTAGKGTLYSWPLTGPST